MLGQTADVTEGCIPLLIKFQGPQSQSYFWDFGDNSNSTEQNPEHTYTSSGDYNVSLSEGQNGPLIGNILISVYPNLDIVLTSDIDSGCIPLDVQFTSTIIKDVGIAIDCLVWTMGDGAELTGLDLMHTYVQAQKELDVSIEAFTTPANCGDIFIFPDMVEAEDLNVLITPFGEIPCTEPATFSYTIDKEKDDRYDYQWDFGNGTTASGYDSGPVTYNNFGIYTVTLTISSPSGCIVTNEEVIQVGPPAITITHPDSVCIGQEFTASTATIANRYEWSYGDTLEKSLQTQITTAYYTPGLKPILLETFLNENCKSDTTVNVFVEVPDSDFTIQPLLFCSDTVDKTLVANVSSHNTYIWNDSLTTNSTFTIEGLAQERDSAYIPVSDTITATLEVISAIGCKSMTEREFADFSKSDSKIVRRTWNYGDNTTQTFTDSTVVHSHTYDTCGVYPLTLEIENEDGCIHKTRARFMLVFGCVGEFTGTDSIPDISEDSVIVDAVDPNMICVNDRVIIPTPTSGLIETNVFMNQERLDYCWQQPVIIHTFDEPGIFFTHYTIDFLDIELARRNLPTYTVEGASSHLTHSMDCSSPRTVTLTSQANNATDLEWVYQGQVISTADSFELDITQPGEHTIYLFAENTPSGCPADVDSTVIYIQDPVADFSLPAEVCDSVPILLDASASSNVFSSCHQGYLWEFETHRPRETSEPILEHEFGSGDQTVRLIVEDINGCTDTIEKNIRAYGIDPAFEIDSFVCLPYTKLLQNNTVSDNAIISWDWNFGSTDYSPTYTFEEKDLVPGTLDTIEVVLAVEDAFGCVDTLTKIVRTFVPSFEIDLIGARVMCQGDSRKFFVIDSLGVEHLFDFEWDF